MYRRIVTFLFPLVLVAAELVVRTLAHIDATGFIAPTVTAVALGLIFPLLAPEDMTKEVSKSTQQLAVETVTYNAADQALSNTANVMIYLFTLVWMLFLFLSLKAGPDEDPHVFGYATWIYACVIYLACAGVAEMREWI